MIVNFITVLPLLSIFVIVLVDGQNNRKRLPNGRLNPTKTPSRRNAPVPKKNSYTVAREKCDEYASYTYANVTYESLLPGGSPYTVLQQMDCITENLVVNGHPAQNKEFPHMALIGYGETFSRVNWACGGSLISERYILTAAHCSKDDAKWVRLGELELNTESDGKNHRDYDIVERILHPGYKPPKVYYDIALFKLNETVKFNPYIRPLCLNTANKLTPDKYGKIKGTVTGWGITGIGETTSDKLLKADINFQNDSVCQKIFNDKNGNEFNANLMVCAGDPKNKRDSCTGDSGGPVQIKHPTNNCMWVEVGIVSYGDAFCGNKPSVYTKILTFIPWIQKIVWP